MKQPRKKKSGVEALFNDTFFTAAIIATLLFLVASWEVRLLIFSVALLAICLYYRSYLHKQEMLQKIGIELIDKMSGVEFEQRLWRLFTDMGYHVETTSTSGDFGADLVLRKGGDVVVVQAKRYSLAVGITAVQEVVAARFHYRATRAMVVTNSNFTSAAQKLAISNGVELWDRNRLISELQRYVLT